MTPDAQAAHAAYKDTLYAKYAGTATQAEVDAAFKAWCDALALNTGGGS